VNLSEEHPVTAKHRELYLELLQRGLSQIRGLAGTKNSKQIFAEADHLHNIPNLLRTGHPDLEKYYLEIERKCFISASEPLYLPTYEAIWKKLLEPDDEADT
jgi:hypothetical protein